MPSRRPARLAFVLPVVVSFVTAGSSAFTVPPLGASQQPAAGPAPKQAKPTAPKRPGPKATSPAPVAPTETPAAAAPAPVPLPRSWQDDDRDIAARFAPILHQGIAGSGRFDFITNFDFDGDWIGDNNWDHAADKKYPLKAYVYYSLSETQTHYFIHYAAFHPRDWKGGEKTGRILSSTIREGTTVAQHVQPRGLADDIVLAHENDLEGCVVAVEKGATPSAAHVTLVETMAHNRYLKYAPKPTSPDIKPLMMEGDHPLLYAEPKGHGIEAFNNQRPMTPAEAAASAATPADGGTEPDKEPKNGGGLFSKMKNVTRVKSVVNAARGEQDEPVLPESIRVYRFSGTADDPENGSGPVGYDLVPLYDTMWKLSRTGRSETFGEANDYGTRTIGVVAPTGEIESKPVVLGLLGSALRGVAGAPNKARPPWGWFDMGERDRPLGEWFFDPAAVLMRHLGKPRDWSVAYLHHPILGIVRAQPRSKT